MESFSDFANRLPRGRTYARNGSVCHLQIETGQVKAFVCGSSLYEVNIHFKTLSAKKWEQIKKKCAGEIGSLLELLQGQLSQEVMHIVSDASKGLFPRPGEMHFDCNCPDWADLCKHIAAVLYGIGHRLDSQPDLLFVLRGVDPQELVSDSFAIPEPVSVVHAIEQDQLAAIFGIEMDADSVPQSPAPRSSKSPKSTPKKPLKPKSSSIRIRPSGASVRRLRKKLGLSLAEFADQADVTIATVKRWEACPDKLQLKARSLEALQQLHQRAY
ncbi:MAG: helix-turn-helix domain-containing protein [Candidatus Sericytochromatia bacterium]|nr:helix-turn-helix domain-containing protein [Candidatus Sericytochromatia bacterium]